MPPPANSLALRLSRLTSAHRIATVQTEDPSGTAMFSALLDVVARSLPELTREEVEGLSVEQVMALVQLTRGQVADVEAMIATATAEETAGNG